MTAPYDERPGLEAHAAPAPAEAKPDLSLRATAKVIGELPADAATQTWMTQAMLTLSDSQFYPAPVLLELTDYEHVQASVFQVARAPGKTLVYLGCVALIVGVFAMLYIVAVGLGPFAGVLALWVHTTGSLAKLFSEAVEAIDQRAGCSVDCAAAMTRRLSSTESGSTSTSSARGGRATNAGLVASRRRRTASFSADRKTRWTPRMTWAECLPVCIRR